MINKTHESYDFFVLPEGADINGVSIKCVGCNQAKLLTNFKRFGGSNRKYQTNCISCYEIYKQARGKSNVCKSNVYKSNVCRNKARIYRRAYLASNPGAKIGSMLRNRIYTAIRNSKTYKGKKAPLLTGCSFPKLKDHLERQFKRGMTWSNHGKWHIDHIIPCAAFDLTDPEQQKQCFHYTNLQPLWAKENRTKGSRIKGPVQMSIAI
jgi:hypothetical protein